MIHVCSLSRLHQTVARTGARHVVTLLKDVHLVARPASIEMDKHLTLMMDDISFEMEGYTAPADAHVTELIRFLGDWDRRTPVVMHCFAGISRSTAGAYVAVCALNPRRDESAVASALRRASPTATPNARIVALADRLLGRGGRMVRAIEGIGRGQEAYEAQPFRLELE